MTFGFTGRLFNSSSLPSQGGRAPAPATQQGQVVPLPHIAGALPARPGVGVYGAAHHQVPAGTSIWQSGPLRVPHAPAGSPYSSGPRPAPPRRLDTLVPQPPATPPPATGAAPSRNSGSSEGQAPGIADDVPVPDDDPFGQLASEVAHAISRLEQEAEPFDEIGFAARVAASQVPRQPAAPRGSAPAFVRGSTKSSPTQERRNIQSGITGDVRTQINQVARDMQCLIFIRDTGPDTAIALANRIGIGKPLSVKGKSSKGSFTSGSICFHARLSKATQKATYRSFAYDQKALLEQQTTNGNLQFVPKYFINEVWQKGANATNVTGDNGEVCHICKRTEIVAGVNTEFIYCFVKRRINELTIKESNVDISVYCTDRVVNSSEASVMLDVYQLYVEKSCIEHDKDKSIWTSLLQSFLADPKLSESPHIKFASYVHGVTTVDPGAPWSLIGATVSGQQRIFVPVLVLAEKKEALMSSGVTRPVFIETVADYDMLAICPSVELLASRLCDVPPKDTEPADPLGRLADYLPKFNADEGVRSKFEMDVRDGLNRAINSARRERDAAIEATVDGQNTGTTGAALATQTAVPPESGREVYGARHGCETSNLLFTVPFDFANLIYLHGQVVGPQHPSIIPRIAYIHALLGCAQSRQTALAYAFGINPAWGHFTIGEQSSDFAGYMTAWSQSPDIAGQISSDFLVPSNSKELLEAMCMRHKAFILEQTSAYSDADIVPKNRLFYVYLLHFCIKLIYYKCHIHELYDPLTRAVNHYASHGHALAPTQGLQGVVARAVFDDLSAVLDATMQEMTNWLDKALRPRSNEDLVRGVPSPDRAGETPRTSDRMRCILRYLQAAQALGAVPAARPSSPVSSH